jgi:signal transduction histidine kinase
MMDEIERLITEARTVGEGIAHELRTPLTRLRITLDHAADCLGRDDPSKALLETCIAETDGLLSRFRALLRIAAVESRGRRGAFTELSLTEVVTQVIELYEPVAALRSVAIHGQLQENVNICGDGELLFEAISNVIDNAIKFSPENSTILVEIRGERSGDVILVTDRGPGIDVRDRPFVTKRFYRAMGAMSVPGHGLGLSLVAAVAEIHGFELSFEDAAPGTIVRFALASPRAARPRAPGLALH